MGSSINKTSIAIIICVAAVAAAAVVGASFVIGGDEAEKTFDKTSDKTSNKTFRISYYNGGSLISENTVSAGTSVTLAGFTEKIDESKKFVGWNTRSDLSGTTLLPGMKLTANADITLHAVITSSDVFTIILPEKQEGFTITADPSVVSRGGSSIISYSLMQSHVDDELLITVNGNPMKLDALKRIYLKEITEDQIVEVSGVYDKIEHSITLPEEQIGYVLTSSAETVHNKLSYTLEYRLLPGYKETSDFGIHVNGGPAKRPIDGTILIEDVRANHEITVTGVEAIEYRVSSGKNISVFVNGVAASKATVVDFITVVPAEGYTLPGTFAKQIKGPFAVDRGIYKVTGDVTFPSVLKVTAGDNVKIGSTGTVFVCPDDKLQITAATGYSLPDNYNDKVKSMNGVKYSTGGFTFSEDIVLPSIYKVVFNGYNKVHQTSFVVGGSMLVLPESNPKRVAYIFGGWNVNSNSFVTSDLSVNSIWSPMTHDVYFGPNLVVTVGSKVYSFGDKGSYPPGIIQIKSDEKVYISSNYGLGLPGDYGPQSGLANYKDGYYEIIENCSFPGVTYVEYVESLGQPGKVVSVIIGQGYTPMSEPIQKKEGYEFVGWQCNGKIINGQITINDEVYFLIPSWRPING